jgi:hypothetical protein
MEVTGPVEKVDNLAPPWRVRRLSPIQPPAPARFSQACESRGPPLSPLEGLKVSLIHSGRNRGSPPAIPTLSTTGRGQDGGVRDQLINET